MSYPLRTNDPTAEMQQRADDEVQREQQQPQAMVHQPAIPGKAGTREQVDVSALFYGVVPVASAQCQPSYYPIQTAAAAAAQARSIALEVSDWILPVFGDGSALPGPPMGYGFTRSPIRGGYAVYLPHPDEDNRWIGVASAVPKVYDCTNSELLALAEALRILCHIRSWGLGRRLRWKRQAAPSISQPLYVRLGTDSQKAIFLLMRGQQLGDGCVRSALYQPIVAEILTMLHHLASGEVYVSIFRMPGHGHGVGPHELADQHARSFAHGGIGFVSPELQCGPVDQRYDPIGPGLQEMVLELGRRHPHFDQRGNGSIFGNQIHPLFDERGYGSLFGGQIQ